VVCAMRRRVWLVPMLVAMFTFVVTPPARASCVEPIPIAQALDEARTVFVGTVTDLQYGGRVATFIVDDVWKGDVSGSVVVNGGPGLSELEAANAQGQDVVTSVDRTYETGGRYLVVSHGNDGDVLLDNACSITQPFSSDLDQYRPESAAAPPGAATRVVTDDGLSVFGWTGLIVLTAGVVGGTFAIVRRLRRLDRLDPATKTNV
jgi:hypothetical protein